jgi:hypothetical protein
MTEGERLDQFDSEFRATVESFLHWRRIHEQAQGLDYYDEDAFGADINSAHAHTRAEALRIIAILKDNGLGTS